MSLIDVREALRDAIKARLPNWSVEERVQAVTTVPAIVIAPSSDVEIPSAEYNVSMGGNVKWYLDVMIFVPFTEMNSNTVKLDKAVSADTPESIPFILNPRNTPTLHDRFEYVLVKKMRDYGGQNNGINGIEHIGAVLKVEAEEICRRTE